VKTVFIVACPRSGTSWLQLLLAQHSTVTTTQETHLFSHYLRPLRQRWENLKAWPSAIGMRPIFTDDEFYALCGDFAKKVLQRIAATNPTATIVVEKTLELRARRIAARASRDPANSQSGSSCCEEWRLLSVPCESRQAQERCEARSSR
jgi:hypothetical protein